MPLSVVHGSDPDHEGWTGFRIIQRELSTHTHQHTLTLSRAEELSSRSVPDARSTFVFARSSRRLV